MIVKVGIIGFGYMGHFHYNKIQEIDGVKVVSVFDTDETKLSEAIQMGLKIHRSINEFLDDTEIDLVVIATPNNWHEKYAIAALKSGKDVMCEKPATMSVKEMENIIECTKETGRIFTVHQNRRWDVDYQVICDVIGKGTIGTATTIESKVMGQRGVCFGWRADPEAGGGMLYDWGVHLIDQMLELYKNEKVVSIYARLLSVLTPYVDDFFEINLTFSNGVCTKISVGTFALQPVPRWFVYGDRGTLMLNDFTATSGGISRIRGEVEGFESVINHKGLGPSRTMAPLKPEQLEILPLPGVNDQPLAFWKNLIEAVQKKTKPYISLDDILRQMKIVEAAFQSAQKNEILHTNI